MAVWRQREAASGRCWVLQRTAVSDVEADSLETDSVEEETMLEEETTLEDPAQEWEQGRVWEAVQVWQQDLEQEWAHRHQPLRMMV